ncbi:MAG: OadG family protein [Anaerotignaceae bacterium]
MFSNVDWILAGAIVFTGLVVVFFVLAFLWFAVYLIGIIGGKIANSAKEKAAMQTPSPQPTVTQPQSQQKLTPEVVAAITAAIANVTDSNFKITNISLHGTSTTLWENNK